MKSLDDFIINNYNQKNSKLNQLEFSSLFTEYNKQVFSFMEENKLDTFKVEKILSDHINKLKPEHIKYFIDMLKNINKIDLKEKQN